MNKNRHHSGRIAQIIHFLVIAILSLGILAFTNISWADGKAPQDHEALAKASQNPIASLISVPFENNATFNNGKDDDFINILNVKPVIPMSFTKNWNLINRIIAPVIYADQDIPGNSAKFGFGDIIYQGFLSPAKSGKVIWGLGPQINIPTGMERFTSDQWAIGPNAVVLTMPGHWVIGLLIGNVWSVGNGYNDAPDVNVLTAQYFINYNMEGGWYLTSAPVIAANWEADSGDEWTVPLGGGLGRVFKIDNQHVNMKAATYYNVVKPDHASNLNIQFSCTFLFPKK